MTDAPEPRKGMPSPQTRSRTEFRKRFLSQFIDPAFEPLKAELDKVVGAAWDGYSNHRKAPRTHKAGAGFADPDYDLADRLASPLTKPIEQAQREHDDPNEPPCILIVNGSSRSEHTCPGEMSKSWRLLEIAREICGVDGTLGPSRSICRGWRPSTGGISTRARPASRPRRRSATGRAAATRIIRSARRRTG